MKAAVQNFMGGKKNSLFKLQITNNYF